MSDQDRVTGGCYCGAIRYESTEEPTGRGMCHCRMCQRWIGVAAIMHVWFDLESFRFTKGKPKAYMTSAILERSFCPECGTSLMHRYVVPPHGPDRVAVYIGTLDDPQAFEGPQYHFGIESHLQHWMILGDGVLQLQADGDSRLAEAWAAVGEERPRAEVLHDNRTRH